MTRDTDSEIYEPVNPEEWGSSVDFFGSEYDVGLSSRETSAGKELTSEGSDGETYAGATVRREFERAARVPTQALWVGHEYSPKDLRTRIAGISHDEWFMQTFFSGGIGTGKSTTILNTLVQQAYAGWGFCFVDPHGDTLRDLLRRLPEYRLDDIVYIAPPTGEFDRCTAFNLLEVPEFQGEPEARYDARVTATVNQNIGVFGANQEMHARMEGVLKNVQRSMIPAEETYTPMSIQKFLQNPDIQEEFSEHIDDDAIEDYNENIANLDQEKIEPLIRRMNDWVLDKIARRVISHPESSVNISRAVEEGKIILVDTQSGTVGDNVSKAIASAVVNRVWATVKARMATTNSPSERRPFFLAIDELQKAVTENTPIPELMQEARKYRLALILATQHPGQIPEEWEDAILGNAKNIMSLRVQDDDSAKAIASKFDDIEKEDIEDLPDYNGFMKLSTDSGMSAPVRVKTFPPTPPLRSQDEVRRVIERSLDKYGVDPDVGTTYDSTTIEQVVRGEGTISTGTSDIETPVMLNAIDAVELFAGVAGTDASVPLSDVAREIQNRVDQDVSTRQLEKAVVQLPESFIDIQSGGDGDMLVSLTVAGREKVRSEGTGDGGSAGGAKHQLLLQEARGLFTRLRCDVTIPDQDVFEGSPPDGIVELPVPREPSISDLAAMDGVDVPFEGKPVSELTVSEIETYRELTTEYQESLPETLAGYHDALPVVSAARDMFIEVESSTRTKPALTLRNLSKAVTAETRCVFVVRGGAAKDTLLRSLSEPAYCRKTGENGRVLYTGDEEFTVDADHGFVALRSADAARTKWRDATPPGAGSDDGSYGVEDTHEFVLEETSGEEVLRVTAADVEAAALSKGAAGAWGGYDADRQAHVAYTVDDDGKVSTRVYDSKDAFKNDWSKISRPFVPEIMFDRHPSREDWCIVVLPNTSTDEYTAPTIVTTDDDGQEEHVITFDAWNTGHDDRDDTGTNTTSTGTTATDTDDTDTDTGTATDTDEGMQSGSSGGDASGIQIPDSVTAAGESDTGQMRGEDAGDGDDGVLTIDDAGDSLDVGDHDFDGIDGSADDDPVAELVEDEGSSGGAGTPSDDPADSWGGEDPATEDGEDSNTTTDENRTDDDTPDTSGETGDSEDEFDLSGVGIEGSIDSTDGDDTDTTVSDDGTDTDTDTTTGTDSAGDSDGDSGSDSDESDSDGEDDEWLF